MKCLRIGDPHVKINNLKDSESLMQFSLKAAKSLEVDRVEILGDLMHNHAVVRVEVLEFWDNWLRKFSSLVQTVVLVGNHDQTGNYSSNQHALSVFKNIENQNLVIIDSPKIDGIYGYMPYVHHEEDFIKAANELAAQGAKVLVCHQTFQGSMFDNGFYAPEGFSFDNLNFDIIISGHIHKRQRFGKVIYPGTAKWDSLSDANEEKGIWYVEHDDNGKIILEKYLDTSGICTPIYSIEWKEGEVQPEIPPGRVTVELIGSSEWIKKQKEKLKGKCGLKSKITDKARPESRNSGKNMLEFIGNSFEPIAGVSREQILLEKLLSNT